MGARLNQLRFFSIVVMMFVVSFSVKSQDILETKLNWKVVKGLDQNSGDRFNYKCSFITNGRDVIQWQQKRGSVVTNLRVNNVTGSWQDVHLAGKIVYDVSTEDQSGTISFERTATELLITLDLSRGQQSRLHHQLTVAELSQK